ncbi:MAG: DNA primase [Nanoarchaeota archaeon]|nr:DNA primase [Nanoarchaeota archaeon]MBU1644400.1 DNA primase [Nanoarchaeota archaeon]MBU1976553.1 DNA primase [Nanoarchaeota archaeon]
MAKISPVAAKYIIHATINIDGIVDRPDVIGAIFGQTEGLLGNDLELRELQRSGKIGRIEVNVNTSSGKTKGEIIVPSSLDKTETAIAAAALEIIQRIGPCNAKIEVSQIEDIRISKRQFVIERAKVLLKELTNNTLPDSQELSYEVAESVRMMEVTEYGPEKLSAGPSIDDSEDIIIVEGRADVLVLLKHGFQNVISINGTSCPQTVKDLTKKKSATIFVDGDRGGDLIIRELLSVADIDFVCKAPDGKEVEELTKKEIHKALRGRITAEQSKHDLGVDNEGSLKDPIPKNTSYNSNRHQLRRPSYDNDRRDNDRRPSPSSDRRSSSSTVERKPYQRTQSLPPKHGQREERLTSGEKSILKKTSEDLFGTRGACIFDQKLNVLGKVPLSELASTVKSLNGGIYAIALDGEVDLELLRLAERYSISHLVGTSSTVKDSSKVNVLTEDKL